jgi:hypothetical protein
MKHHSGWLAAGLLLFAVLACNTTRNGNTNNSNNSNNSNSNSNKNSSSSITNRPANADVYIDKIHMAKDKNGDPGETTTTFKPGDHTIHCVVTLNKAKAGTVVEFVWFATDVAGSKSESIKKLDYTTKAAETEVHGHLTFPNDWPKGTYDVEVYVNDALDKTINYTVE